MKKTLISSLLTASLTLSSVFTGFIVSAVPSHAASFSDISDHWAKDYIIDAANKNIISGYPDGTFLPDKAVTRAEFIKMVNNALGNNATSSVTFTDVPAAEWYHTEISKAVAAGYAGGYDTGEFLPNNNITRQEAAVMLSRIVPTYNYSASLTSYGDRASISDWAESSLSRIVGKKYMGAYDDGNLHPLDNLTRAQAAKIICDIVDNETIVKNALTISEEDTKVSNKIYSNGITISKNVGEGDVTIDNCVVLGALYVQGGGASESSDDGEITINNSRVASCQISKTASAVLVHAKNETRILETSAYKTTHLHTSSLKGGLFGTGFDKVTLYGNSETYFDGSFPAVTINGADCQVNFESGTITTLNIENAGKNSEVSLDSHATITTANVNAVASFKGNGTIRTMNANESGITYETKPSTINTKSGKTAPKYTDEDDDISVTPKRGEDNVDVDSTIKISFSTAVTKYSSGKTLTSSDLEDLIELRKKSTSGTKVAFSASINSSKKTVTITPDSDLDEDTRYYVIIDKNTFKYTDGKGNAAFQTYFNTGDDDADGDISISPKNKATGVSISRPTIKITFDSKMTRYSSGSSLTASYAEDSIELHRDKATGSDVSFTVTSVSSTSISLRPDSNLRYDTDYYVVIPKNKFMDSSKNGNDKFTSYFTTEKETATGITEITSESTEDTITVTVVSNTSGSIYGVLLPSTSKAPSSTQVYEGKDGSGAAVGTNRIITNKSIAKNGKITQKFEDLESDKSYVFYAIFRTGSTNSSVEKRTVSTSKPSIPSARLTSLSVSSDASGTVTMPSFNASTTSYDVTVPYGTQNVTVSANAAAGTDILYKGSGSSYDTENSFPVSGSTENKIEVRAFGSGMNDTIYTLNVKVKGNTAKGSVKVSNATSDSNHTIFIVPAGTESVNVEIAAQESSATVVCTQLSNTSGTGTLSGELNLTAGTGNKVKYKILSNRDEESYEFTITFEAADDTEPSSIIQQ